MCECVSWIEKDSKVYFLTPEDIDSKFGKEKLEGCIDNDYIGHGAIRKFYGVENGKEMENQHFWDGNIPKEIKEAWNSGSLSGMLKYLQYDDIQYIIENAPEPFWKYVLNIKYSKKNLAEMKTDSNWINRMIAHAKDGTLAEMKDDADRDNRLIAHASDGSLAEMKNDRNRINRMIAHALSGTLAEMKDDSGWINRLIAHAISGTLAEMKNVELPIIN